MLARRVSADERQLAYFFASYCIRHPAPECAESQSFVCPGPRRASVAGTGFLFSRSLGFATSRRFARRRWLMVPFGRGIRTSHTSPALSSLLTCWRRRVATSRASPPSPARPPNRLTVGLLAAKESLKASRHAHAILPLVLAKVGVAHADLPDKVVLHFHGQYRAHLFDR